MALSPAMESIFANAQQNAASLIETATLAINAKVNTIEEAEKMIEQLSSEAVKFNELLKDIANAMHQVESGDMSKEEAAGIIAPAVKELKDKCCALKIANAEAPGDDITEDEIAILRELIIGTKAAAEDRLVAIRLGDDDKVDPEIEAELNTAEEGFISNFLERRSAKKAIRSKIDQFWLTLQEKNSTSILNVFGKSAAPLLYSGPSGSTMLNYFINEMLREDARSGKNYDEMLSAKDYIVKTVAGVPMAILPGSLDKKGVTHIIAPYQNKNGKIDIMYFFKKDICAAMMDPIKVEDVAPAKEAYEASIANKKYESEELTMENYSEFMYACEAYMDSLEDELAMEAATESAFTDKVKGGASAIGAKLRAGFTKLRKAVRIGDKKAAAEARKEVEDAADELDAATAADPEKKGLSTAAKIGIAAAATAVVAAGMYGAGKKLDKMSKEQDLKLNGVGKMLKGMAGGVDNAAGKVKSGAAKASDKIGEKVTQARHDAFVAKKGNGEKKWAKHEETRAANAAKHSETIKSIPGKVKGLPSQVQAGVKKGSDKAFTKLFGVKSSMNEFEDDVAFEAFDLYEIIMEAIEEEYNDSVDVIEESMLDMLEDYNV